MTQQNNSRSTFVLIVLLLIKYICYYIKLKQNAFPTSTTTSGLDIGYVPASPHAFFRLSGHNNSFPAGPRGQ